MRFAGRVFETPVFRKVVTPSILLKKPPELATTEVKAILEGGAGEQRDKSVSLIFSVQDLTLQTNLRPVGCPVL